MMPWGGARARLLAGLAFLAGGVGQLSGQEYHVDLEAERRVVFRSSTPVNEFDGVTDRIDGYVLLDGEGLREAESLSGGELYFEVDLASLKTGIGLRDRHMRENYLEVEDHPYATFSGGLDRIRREGADFVVTSTGEFSVHGVTRERTLECRVASDGEGLRVRCVFPVDLADHDIDIPRVMFLELAPEVELELDFGLRPAG